MVRWLGWLEDKPEPLGGESQEQADRRTRAANRTQKWLFTWEVVIPGVILCVVLVILAVKSL